MNLIQAIEIFAFVTGLLYVILEIGQKNAMWVVGILTGVACAWSFGVQRLWASMGLNIYYVCVSVWGLYQWRRDSRLLTGSGTVDSSSEAAPKASIHLRKPSRKTVLVSSPQVKEPKFVRYAYAGYRGDCNLQNAEGLPAYPFRSDAVDYSKVD